MAGNDHQDRVDASELSGDLSSILRARRESLGWPLDRMASRTGGVVDADTLEQLESGEHLIESRMVVRALASSYEVEPALLYSDRRPIEVGTGYLAVGAVRVEYYSGHIDDVLVAYLELLRMLRGNVEAPIDHFRRIDIDALGVALDYPPEAIVGRLAILIGARGLRQAAMAASYAAGDRTISTGHADAKRPPADEGPWDDHATGPLGSV